MRSSIVLLFLGLFLFCAVTYAPTIPYCFYIETGGNYTMNQSITGANESVEFIGAPDACIYIRTSNVYFDCNGFNITNNESGNTAGIVIYHPDSASNISIVNCPFIFNYTYGIELYLGGNMTLENITINGTTSYGLYVLDTIDNINVSNLSVTYTASTADTAAVYLGASVTYNRFDNITILNTTGSNSMGLLLLNDGGAEYNNFTNLDIREISGHGINGGDNYNRYLNVYINGTTADGYHVESNAVNTNVTNMTIIDVTSDGLYFWNHMDSTYNDINVTGSKDKGVYFHAATYNLSFTNLVITNTSNYGVYFGYDTSGNDPPRNNTVTNVTLFNNNGSGIGSYYSDNNTVQTFNVSGCGSYGIYVENSNFTIYEGLLYNNTEDLYVNTSGGAAITANFNISRAVFTNPYGSYENYTNLSIFDNVTLPYTITWDVVPGSLPTNYASFSNKSVNISNASTTSIDSIVWHWAASELTGYNESKFELYVNNASGWTALNTSPDTTANTLGLNDFIPGSAYAILEDTTAATTNPNMTVVSPITDTAYNVSYVDINWSVDDVEDATVLCNISLNGAVEVSNINVSNGVPYNRTLFDLTNGTYTWNLTCWDSDNSLNESADRNFTIDTEVPSITENSPIDGYVTNSTNITIYNITATDGVYPTTNCTLFLNSVVNNTNNTAPNNTATAFNVTSPQANYSWYVQCIDGVNNTGFSTARTMVLDSTVPSITMNSPPSNYTINSTNVTIFNFTVTDNIFSTTNCSLYLDDVINSTNNTVSNNTPTTFNVSIYGSHNWSILCRDGANNSDITGVRNFTNDQVVPVLTINSPIDGYVTNSTNVTIYNFTMTDDVYSSTNCSLYLNSVLNNSNGTTLNNTATTFNVTSPQANYSWYVQCIDGVNNSDVSTARTLVMDSVVPSITLNSPAADYTGNDTNLTFNFTVTDNIFSSLINCSLYLDGSINQTNNGVANNTPTTFNTTVSAGNHNWSILCRDGANNSNQSATRDFFSDQQSPSITLNLPDDGYDFVVASSTDLYEAYFNYSVYDDNSSTINCTFYLNSVANQTNSSITNATSIALWRNLSLGTHNWYVYCIDASNNTNTSATRSVDVVATVISSSSSGSTDAKKIEIVEEPTISLTYSRVSCPANQVTLTASSGKQTSISISLPNGNFLSKQTDSSGKATFSLTENSTYTASASKDEYESGSLTFSFKTCVVETTVKPPIKPPVTPPRPSNGGVKPPKPECKTNSECGGTEYCGSGGKCEPVKGTCGTASNHKWNAYQCCEHSHCGVNEGCVDHACKPFLLKANDTGKVGSKTKVQIVLGGKPFSNGEVKITQPDGKTTSAKTDAKGEVELPLNLKGEYQIDFIRDGKVVRRHRIDSTITGLSGSGDDKKAITIVDQIKENASAIIVVLVTIGIAVFAYRLLTRGKAKTFRPKSKEL